MHHDARDDANMVVMTAAGVAIFGRVVEGAKVNWVHVLRPEWVWKDTPSELV